MKRMRLFVLGLLAMVAVTVNGQINVGASLGLQMPVGDFADGFNAGIGFHALGKYMLNDNMAVGLNLGYSKFGSESDSYSCSMVPITGLFEYYLSKKGKITPYVGADLGLYSMGVKVKYMGISSSDSKMYLGLAPTAGVLYELNDLLSLFGNLKYNMVFSEDNTTSFVGINVGVAYKLNLKK